MRELHCSRIVRACDALLQVFLLAVEHIAPVRRSYAIETSVGAPYRRDMFRDQLKQPCCGALQAR